MKTSILIGILVVTANGLSRDSSSNTHSRSLTSYASQPSVEGEWKKTGAGFDENNNGTLDDSEIKHDKSLSGYDYFHFYPDGKCIFDSDVKFNGTYVIKPDKYNKRAIFIYGSGMPEGLSQKQKDGAAYVYRIHSIQGNKLILAPAHLQGKLVVYERI